MPPAGAGEKMKDKGGILFHGENLRILSLLKRQKFCEKCVGNISQCNYEWQGQSGL